MAIEFFPLASYVVATTFSPGPNNVSSTSMGVSFGYRQTLPYLLGIASGFFVVMLLCGSFSSALLAQIPMLETAMRWIGAAYILWLAFGALRATYSSEGKANASSSFQKGLWLQLLNPKVAIYGLTLYTTFLAPLNGRLDALLLSALAFAATAFIATSIWALFGAAARVKLTKPGFRRGVNLLLASVLLFTAFEMLSLQ